MRIVCLPLASEGNPYQILMMHGLARAGHEPVAGAPGRFFPFRRSKPVQPDAYHLDWPGSYYLRRDPAASLVQLAAFKAELAWLKASRIPLVWTCHNLAEHDVPHPALDMAAKRALAAVATRLRVFSAEQATLAGQLFRVADAKIVVQPEGSYVGYYPHTKTNAEARAALSLQTGGRVLLHFGNLRPYKGTDLLLAAFFRYALPDDQLVIAGPAHTPAYIAQLARQAGGDSRVFLHPGFVAKEQVQNYFAAADLAVLPFRRITNSGSVILAMGFGLPVVAPASGRRI